MTPSTRIPVTADELAAIRWRKSTRSQGAGANCVEVGTVPWRTSTRSQGGSGNCVELGPVPDGSARVAVRDSKDRDGAVFVFADTQWTAFLDTVRTGTLDPH